MHGLALGRQPDAGQRPQPLEQPHARGEALRRRRLEPLEVLRVAAPGQHLEERPGQVHALDLRLAPGAEAVALVPEPDHAPRPRPTRPPRALLRRVGRDPLQLQPVEGARGVVAQDLVLARVDHVGHTLDGERRLGHVRRQDDLALRRTARVPCPALPPGASRGAAAPARRRSSRSPPAPAGSRAPRAGSRGGARRVAPRPTARSRPGTLAARTAPRSGTDGRARRSPGSRRERPRPAPRRASPTSPGAAGRRGRATPAGRTPARGRRGGSARGTRRARSSGSRSGAGPTGAAASGCPRSPPAGGCPSRSAARSGPGSPPPRRASSPAPRRCGARSTGPPPAAAAAGRRGRRRRAPAAPASSCPTRAARRAPRRATSPGRRARAATWASMGKAGRHALMLPCRAALDLPRLQGQVQHLRSLSQRQRPALGRPALGPPALSRVLLAGAEPGAARRC